MACELDYRKGYFCPIIHTWYIMHQHIIFFQINILLLGYQEFGSKSLNIPKLIAHNLLFPKKSLKDKRKKKKTEIFLSLPYVAIKRFFFF